MATTVYSSRMMASTSGLTSKRLESQIFIALSFVCLFLAVPLMAVSQEISGNLPFASRPVIYNNPTYDSVVVMEFPISFNRASLDFYRPDSSDPSFYGRVYAEVILFDTAALAVDTANTYFSVPVDDPQAAETTSVMLFNKLGLVAKPGTYSARVTVIDAVSKRSNELFFPNIYVPEINRTRLMIGGPVLAYRVSRVTDSAQMTTDRMVRSGYKVLANPSGIFTTSDTTIHLYAEIYNLAETAELSPKYRLTFAVVDTGGNLVQGFGFVERPKPGKTAVVAESFDLSGWRAGNYQFCMVVSDPVTAQADTALMPLRIIPPYPIVVAARTNIPMAGDPYDSLTVQQQEQLVKYLLTPDQQIVLQRLNDEGKKNFLAQFWRENDVDPTTSSVENRDEMIRRYQYANQHFSINEGHKDGWMTDRGRIYMRYGHWDERDDYPAPRVGNPYSIWYYNAVEEGVVFVFEDQQGDHDYRLVHSTAKGERYSKDWAEYLMQTMTDIQTEEAPTQDKE